MHSLMACAVRDWRARKKSFRPRPWYPVKVKASMSCMSPGSQSGLHHRCQTLLQVCTIMQLCEGWYAVIASWFVRQIALVDYRKFVSFWHICAMFGEEQVHASARALVDVNALMTFSFLIFEILTKDGLLFAQSLIRQLVFLWFSFVLYESLNARWACHIPLIQVHSCSLLQNTMRISSFRSMADRLTTVTTIISTTGCDLQWCWWINFWNHSRNSSALLDVMWNHHGQILLMILTMIVSTAGCKLSVQSTAIQNLDSISELRAKAMWLWVYYRLLFST